MRSAFLSLWVVYDRPRDFPAHVVVREQAVLPGGDIGLAPVACLYGSLAEMRDEWVERGLFWLERQPGDDPFIVGVWL